MDSSENRLSSHEEEPLEIEVFYPDDVILIDSRTLPRQHPPAQRMVPRPRPLLALGLFLATCLSTFFTGMIFLSDSHIDSSFPFFSKADLHIGLTYSIAIISILLFHEMGHFLQSKRYGIPASYPYFIPMPFNPFGTMGAVILQGSGVANRKSLFDVAISGPLAGLVVALPCVIYGIAQSEVIEVPQHANTLIFGNPPLINWIAEWYHGVIPPNFMLKMNPFLFAGWVGIFITALNLIPIGQLDGGHVLYTLIGKRAHLVAHFILIVAVTMMIVTRKPTYMLMVFLLFMMGANHPPTEDDSVPLGKGRVILGWLTLAFIFIGFTVDPLLSSEEIMDNDRENRKEEVDRKNKPKLVIESNRNFAKPNRFPFGHEVSFSPPEGQPEESNENPGFPDVPDKSYQL